ncbi:ATP-dependent translocase ABCB1-like [Ylistrum balloti]|uniref:ATP-dependent translocase ABCB1-like n=1 Tax=Ylistrum balloti TaxID=509963 RepID=UPI002905A820|nr:ATP-dependent translocase ABCB1-like [Ylistrum balloti]
MMDSTDEKQPLLGENAETSQDHVDPKDTKPTPKAASFGDLFRYATCLDKFLMLLGSLFSIVHGGGWPVLSIVFGQMTTEFVFGPGGTNDTKNDSSSVVVNSSDSNQEFSDNMTKYALYQVYIGAAVFVAAYFQTSCWTTACERQVNKIRLSFFRSILKQDIAWFDQKKSGELTTRLADDLERVREGIGDKIGLCIQYLAAFFGGFSIGFWKSWKMTLVMMSLTPLMVICAAMFSKKMQSLSKNAQASYSDAGSIAEEVLSCIRTVISHNGQKQERNRYEQALKICKSIGVKKGVIQGLLMGFVFITMFSSYGLAFWYGTELVKDYFTSNGVEGIEPGTVLTVFFCVMIGSFSIGNAAPSIGNVFIAKGSAAVLIEIIDREPDIDASSPRGQRPPNIDGNIELKNIFFSYPEKEKRPETKVLKNFNMSVKQGQTVALVGPSGCGKSTVMSLLQRLYDPKSGEVLLDGVNLKDLNVAWLRRNIGVVSQEPILFGYSITQNIRLGNPSATNQEIEDAAKAANAHDFIAALPEGYNTMVGERGAQLSGGQKQRVAIARALVRNPRILLLDEATSALDSKSEKIVQDALDKARKGRTTIVIAHRLSTIQNSDVIYVVDDGRIFEQGTHSELMDKQGLYHELVMAQALAEGESDDEDHNEDDRQSHTEAKFKAKRSRKVSYQSSTSDKPVRQISRQMSRQISINDKGKTDNESKEKEVDEKEIEEEEYDPPKYLRILRENAPEWHFILLGCIASGIGGCTMPAFAIFFSEMIKVTYKWVFINQGEDSVLWSMMFVGLGVLNFIVQLISNVCFAHSGENLTLRLRLNTFSALLRQDVAYFDDPRHATGALTTRLATDATLLQTVTGIRLSIIVSSFVSLVAALVISFIFGWKLALVVLGGVPILAAAGYLQFKVITGQHKGDEKTLENAGKVASEAIENIRTVQTLSREEFFFKEYYDSLKGPLRTFLKQAQMAGFAFGFSQGIIFMMYGGAFRFGAWQVELGDMEPSNVYRVFFAIAFTGITIGQASSFLPEYSKAKHAAGLIFKVIDTIPPIDIYSKRGVYMDKMDGQISIKDINFNYPWRSEVKVLKNLTFEVKAGQTVALVGSSGCGKSTVISLLQRYYDPMDGGLSVDGRGIKEINVHNLRSNIGVVSQEPILFDCSFKDNIAYGLDRMAGMDEVIEAARAANIHEFISTLPMGYDTTVGEKGTQLSGGQKQRVAIARALIRNPKILLLDEATSALDTESEKLVQSALDNVQQGRTCIVIAHRLSTIQNADVIYVMDSGQIVEKGTHQELIAQKGVYSALVNAQQLAM